MELPKCSMLQIEVCSGLSEDIKGKSTRYLFLPTPVEMMTQDIVHSYGLLACDENKSSFSLLLLSDRHSVTSCLSQSLNLQ